MNRSIVLLVTGLLCVVVQSTLAQTFEEAASLFQRRKFDHAKPILEQVVKRDNKHAQAHYYLATICLLPAHRDDDRAVDLAEVATELEPNNADYHYILGAALGTKARDAGMIKQAFLAPKIKNAFARAVELNPNHTQARIGLAQYYMNAPSIMGGDKAKAAEHIEAVISLDEVVGRSYKARMLESEKKLVEAEQQLTTLVQNRPSDWRGWKNLGYFYVRTEKPEKAIDAFRKYVAAKPDTADAYDSLAEGFLKKGEADQAIVQLTKSLELDQTFAPSLMKLGRAYEMKKQPKEAREAYQKLLAVDSNPNRRKEAEQKLKELK